MTERKPQTDAELALESVERELRRREQLFRALVESSPDLIARFDRELRRVYVNPAIERLTGMQSPALMGTTMRDLNFDARFSAPIEQALAEVFASGTETTLEVILPSSQGERVFHARIVPERGPGEVVEFALVISRDITDIRRDQERLRTVTREVELLLESTYEGICAADVSGRCTLVNVSASSMLGYPRSEMIGASLHELIHDPNATGSSCRSGHCSLMKAAQEGKPTHVVHEVLRRKDGSSFPVEMFVSPILGDDRTIRGTVASFIDITAREQLQTELERANHLVGLGRVASAMAHEFNNVLMGIQPFAEILVRSSQEARAVDAGKRIIQSVQRGRGITEDLRAFTRADPPARTPLDVHAWLSEVSGDLAALLPPTVRFEIVVADDPMSMEVDRNQITQVLRNIILNARDAMEGEAGSIRLAVELTRNAARLGSNGPFVHFSLSDDGPGIDPRNLPRVFEPFFSTKKGGKGLGLAIAQQIAVLHGGHLYLESEVGSGTTVHLFLPESSKNADVPAEPVDHSSTQGRWPAKILLVEDDAEVASGVVILLEDENVHVRLAEDGATAMELLRSYKPQALVIDINLPDCNGFDLYEQITAAFGPLPVVFASGHADAARLGELKTSAGVRLLAKPYAIDALLDSLNTLAPAG